MKDAFEVLKRLQAEVDAIPYERHVGRTLTGAQMTTYTDLMEHVRTETDAIYAEIQALVPSEMRERLHTLCNIVGQVEELRCAAGNEEQREDMLKTYRETVNRGVPERKPFTPYDPKYALVHAMANHFHLSQEPEPKKV